MSRLSRGVYDTLLTELLSRRLGALDAGYDEDRADLRAAEAADRLALHVAGVLERAIDSLPDDERASLARRWRVG